MGLWWSFHQATDRSGCVPPPAAPLCQCCSAASGTPLTPASFTQGVSGPRRRPGAWVFPLGLLPSWVRPAVPRWGRGSLSSALCTVAGGGVPGQGPTRETPPRLTAGRHRQGTCVLPEFTASWDSRACPTVWLVSQPRKCFCTDPPSVVKSPPTVRAQGSSPCPVDVADPRPRGARGRTPWWRPPARLGGSHHGPCIHWLNKQALLTALFKIIFN